MRRPESLIRESRRTSPNEETDGLACGREHVFPVASIAPYATAFRLDISHLDRHILILGHTPHIYRRNRHLRRRSRRLEFEPCRTVLSRYIHGAVDVAQYRRPAFQAHMHPLAACKSRRGGIDTISAESHAAAGIHGSLIGQHQHRGRTVTAGKIVLHNGVEEQIARLVGDSPSIGLRHHGHNIGNGHITLRRRRCGRLLPFDLPALIEVYRGSACTSAQRHIVDTHRTVRRPDKGQLQRRRYRRKRKTALDLMPLTCRRLRIV